MSYRSEYGINRKGKRTFAGGGGQFQSKTSRGVGKRHADYPSPPKAIQKNGSKTR